MKAVGNYIIVKDEEVIQKNDLGLIITEESDNNIRYIIGEVVSVGADVKEVEVGGKVYFDKIFENPPKLYFYICPHPYIWK